MKTNYLLDQEYYKANWNLLIYDEVCKYKTYYFFCAIVHFCFNHYVINLLNHSGPTEKRLRK